jgi:hypothetical protein
MKYDNNFEMEISSNYRYSIFLQSYKQSRVIKPARYVWHISCPKNRESIQQQGIIKIHRDYAVFANNIQPRHHNLMLFWPLPIDSYDHPSLSLIEFYLLYDFWRIDTHAYDAEWRIDTNMAHDTGAFNLESVRHYVCSTTNVPANAVKRYRYRGEKRAILYNAEGASGVIIPSVLKAA